MSILEISFSLLWSILGNVLILSFYVTNHREIKLERMNTALFVTE